MTEDEVRLKDIEEIKTLVKELGISEKDLEETLRTYNVKTVDELNREQAEDLKIHFQGMVKVKLLVALTAMALLRQ